MANYHDRSASRGLLPFDLIVTVQDVLKRWLVILLAVALTGLSSYIFADQTYTPQYCTVTTFVVTNHSTGATVYNNLTATNNLAGVFSDLLNSSLMRKSILETLGEPSFDGTIRSGVIEETNLLTVTVTASDPRSAFLVAQAIIDHHEDVTYHIIDNVSLEVLQSPKVPMAPINAANPFALMKRNMLLAAAACVALLGLMSFTRDAVRSEWEARNKLDCSFLGQIPHEQKHRTILARFRRRKPGILITNPTTSFRFVEILRKLRRRIEQRLQGKQVLMVTSLLENEGKSTVAVNLALAMAQTQKKVLLIECDLRKPACHVLLERQDVAHGVREVLSGKISPQDALLLDKKSGLHLLLESKSTRNSGDLLGSQAMQTLLQWARREFDLVILDLPPMAEVSDAEAMTRYADASILVVRQNAAIAPALNKAIAALGGGNAKFLGTVLNNVYSFELSGSRGYGYGTHGKYGRYYGAGERD